VELLYEDNTSNRAVWRQLQARIRAGERSIPQPQQAKLGPLPLWQQCMLEVASQCGGMRVFRPHDEEYAAITSGMRVAQDGAAIGSTAAGVTTPLQRLLGSEAFVAGPPVAPQPARLPWGRLVAQAAVELRQPQLLAWALQQQQRQRLWGSSPIAAAVSFAELEIGGCSPIKCKLGSNPEQQRLDLQQLRQH
jgi:hypothetical protein